MHVDILFNHIVTRIRIENSVASSVFVQESSHNRTHPVKIYGKEDYARADSIQNPRLLPLSLPNKLPIGLFFCEHPHLYFYIRSILDERTLQSIAYQPPSGTRVVHAIHLSSAFSIAHRLQSVTFSVPIGIPGQTTSRVNFLGRNGKAIITTSTIRAEMSPSKKNSV